MQHLLLSLWIVVERYLWVMNILVCLLNYFSVRTGCTIRLFHSLFFNLSLFYVPHALEKCLFTFWSKTFALNFLEKKFTHSLHEAIRDWNKIGMCKPLSTFIVRSYAVLVLVYFFTREHFLHSWPLEITHERVLVFLYLQLNWIVALCFTWFTLNVKKFSWETFMGAHSVALFTSLRTLVHLVLVSRIYILRNLI